MNIEDFVSYGLAFSAGLVVGALACYLILAHIYKHRRVKDELLKSRREAVRAQRTLDTFLKTSLDIYEELDDAHQQYAKFLSEAAQRLNPDEALAHAFTANYQGTATRGFKRKFKENIFNHKDEASAHPRADENQSLEKKD